MTIELPPLPYDPGALAPYVSLRALAVHYGQHHRGYVDKLNQLVRGTPWNSKMLEEIIVGSAAEPSRQPIFNNAAQVWNHTFFWKSMKPNGGGSPQGVLNGQLNATFGTIEKFRNEFKERALGLFGSGWIWLIVDSGALQITTTSNGGLPLTNRQTALLACDLWEHAYYLDYQSRRADFVQAFLYHLCNWDFAQRNFEKAMNPLHAYKSRPHLGLEGHRSSF